MKKKRENEKKTVQQTDRRAGRRRFRLLPR